MQQFDDATRRADIDAESGAEKGSASLPDEPEKSMHYQPQHAPGAAAAGQRAVRGEAPTSRHSAPAGAPAGSPRGRPVPPAAAGRPSKFFARVLWYLR
jgi:hypothetical protein